MNKEPDMSVWEPQVPGMTFTINGMSIAEYERLHPENCVTIETRWNGYRWVFKDIHRKWWQLWKPRYYG